MRMTRAGVILSAMFLAGALLVAHACNSGGGHRKLQIRDGQGRPTVTVQSYDSLLVSLEGAEPESHYDFVVSPDGSASPVIGQARLMTDQSGDIPPALLVIDADPQQVPTGEYEVRVSGPELDETVHIRVVEPGEPYVFSCDVLGNPQNSYILGEPAYVTGANFPPNAEVHVAPIPDRSEYRDGEALLGPSSGGENPLLDRVAVVTWTDAQGVLPITELTPYTWFLSEGDAFDMVADLAPYNVFDLGRDAVDGHAVVGATFQVLDVGTDVDSDLASAMDGTYKDTFSTTENIYLWINPPIVYLTPHGYVDKYIVAHRDEWRDGDILEDVSGGSEMDGVQHGCTNEYIVQVSGPLPAGEYDAIIDVNQDGKYTQGLDIVDGGSAESLGKVGFTVQ